MTRDLLAASLARISAYGRLIPVLAQQFRAYFNPSDRYRREAYYMRGPGPKFREKQSAQTSPKS